MTGILSQIDTLSAALRLGEVQHRVISQNLANANTVGYKTQQIDFEQLLSDLAIQEQDKIPDKINIQEVAGLPERIDGNNVDLAAQISALKGNALLYQSFSQILASKVATMRKAISG